MPSIEKTDTKELIEISKGNMKILSDRVRRIQAKILKANKQADIQDTLHYPRDSAPIYGMSVSISELQKRLWTISYALRGINGINDQPNETGIVIDCYKSKIQKLLVNMVDEINDLLEKN